MRVAVCLPGAYFGFYAHAGFVKALDRLGIAPVAVSGASAGALVAALWAAGCSGAEIERLLAGLRRADFWEPRCRLALARAVLTGFRGWTGLLAGKRLRALIERALPVRTFEECRFPLHIVTTDLTTGRRAVFRSGLLAPAVHASLAHPFLFASVRIGESEHVDGAFVDKVPLAELLGARADLVLVHFLRSRTAGRWPGLARRFFAPAHLLRRGIDILRAQELAVKLELAAARGERVVLVTPAVPPVGVRQLSAGPAALAAAEAYAMAVVPAILAGADRRRD